MNQVGATSWPPPRRWPRTSHSTSFAFQNNDIDTAAAISVEPLVVGLVVAGVFVARSGSFDAD